MSAQSNTSECSVDMCMRERKGKISRTACNSSFQRTNYRKNGTRRRNGCSHANPEMCKMLNNISIHAEESSAAAGYFRKLSSEVSGCAYTIPEDHVALFATCQKFRPEPVGVIVFKIANTDDVDNKISFQFVLQLCQGHGIGKQLLEGALKKISLANHKRIVLDACKRSVGFYKRHGFQQVGSPVLPVRGSPMFATLFHMEKQ